MVKPFDRIWMQEAGTDDATWCEDRVTDDDAEYVLAARVKEGLVELEKMLATAETLDVERLRRIKRLEGERAEIDTKVDGLLAQIERLEVQTRGVGVFIPRSRVNAALRLAKFHEEPLARRHMQTMLKMLGISEGLEIYERTWEWTK